MSRLKKWGLGAGLLLAGLATVAYAQRGRWQFLGESHVDGQADHDRISVTGARGEFRAIRLRVDYAPVEFDRVLVHFGNGSSEPISLRLRIPAGGQTRIIDLPGARRVIESVEFWYQRANPGSRRPRVRLFGLM